MADELRTTNGAWRSSDGRFWMLPSRRFRTDGRKPLRPTRLNALITALTKTLESARSGSPSHALTAVRTARSQLDLVEREAVAYARSCQWSWRDVAEVLGMTAPAAHRRFASDDAPGRKRRGR